MSLEKEVEILKRIPLFSNIDNSKLKLMCFASERMTFKAGEVLCRQGDPGDSAEQGHQEDCGEADEDASGQAVEVAFGHRLVG